MFIKKPEENFFTCKCGARVYLNSSSQNLFKCQKCIDKRSNNRELLAEMIKISEGMKCN